MTTDEIKYYETFTDMFANEGWKQFIDEMTNNIKLINNIEVTKDSDDLNFRKGQLNVLAYCLNFEAQVDNVLTMEAEESEAA